MHYDLLVHVDLADEGRFGMAMTNIINYRKALPGEVYTVVVLANAAAVRFLKREDNPHAETVRTLAAEGVDFRACRNATTKFGIADADLLDCVTVVPAGIVEVVDLQRKGFAYLKP